MSGRNLIIFVCTSNTCRSPMAQGIANLWINENGKSDEFEVQSRALTDAYEEPDLKGSPPSEQGVIVLREDFGIDISDHKSSLLTLEDVLQAHSIVGVSISHMNSIIQRYPEYVDIYEAKVSRLERNISDPWQGPIEEYRRCAALMAPLIGKKLEEIVVSDKK